MDIKTTQAIEDYVKSIYAIQGEGKGPVTTSALAESLNVTDGSASAMAKRLADLKLIRRVPYRGFVLTPRGRQVALEVIRHHRLLELYLVEALDVPWDRVHAEAEILEHVLSEDLEERIAKKLGNPRFDPHGDPIPTKDGAIDAPDTVSLSELEPGDRAKLISVSDSEPGMLRYLAERAIRPGVSLEVVDKQPFDGPVFARVGDEVHALGGKLARVMRVKPRR